MAGNQLTTDELRNLVDLVQRVGRADDARLAGRLEHALQNQIPVIVLTAEEREILLSALDDPPEGLTELRKQLQRETLRQNRDRF